MILAVSLVLLSTLTNVHAAKTCWPYGNCANQSPKLKTIPDNVPSFRTLGVLLLQFNDIEELKYIPQMPALTHLDLSHNRLSEFPWLSFRNISRIKILILKNNEVSKVDAYVDFPQNLTYLDLEGNRIATIPETFLNGLKPQRWNFFLCISQNPFLCDCKIQWIARFRRCVWEHRHEGCVDAPLARVRRCMLANCKSNPSGVPVILDWFQWDTKLVVQQLTLRCESPQELRGKTLRNVTLPTCSASPKHSRNPEKASSPVRMGIHEYQKASVETVPSTLATNSRERTTVSTSEFSPFWKGITASILGGVLITLLVAFLIRCVSRCNKRRQAGLNSMAAAPPVPAVTEKRQTTPGADQSNPTVDGRLEEGRSRNNEDTSRLSFGIRRKRKQTARKYTAAALPLQTVQNMRASIVVSVDRSNSVLGNLQRDPSQKKKKKGPGRFSLDIRRRRRRRTAGLFSLDIRRKRKEKAVPKNVLAAFPLQTLTNMHVANICSVAQNSDIRGDGYLEEQGPSMDSDDQQTSPSPQRLSDVDEDTKAATKQTSRL
ncbi:PREDICTED: uncharacterized protein LOC109478445 [Branchiostoma belcheri]|uniref:Uncharacterized protein LOC109478445 n=1 Tax=Branchiostoma belcheri TaxID=7741 RepID=A0A6P5A157_BRABE|nr:PREDICTED: uncharacterized protein LOC109478445 [Branchiostoma belcheri]